MLGEWKWCIVNSLVSIACTILATRLTSRSIEQQFEQRLPVLVENISIEMNHAVQTLRHSPHTFPSAPLRSPDELDRLQVAFHTWVAGMAESPVAEDC